MYPVAFGGILSILILKQDPKLYCSNIVQHLGESLP